MTLILKKRYFSLEVNEMKSQKYNDGIGCGSRGYRAGESNGEKGGTIVTEQ